MEHLDNTENAQNHSNVDTETEEDDLEWIEETLHHSGDERDEEGNLKNRGDYGVNSQETETPDDNMDDTLEDDRDEALDDNMNEIPGDSTEDQEAEASEDNTEDEAERGRHLRNGFRILKTMHCNYKKFNPGAPPTWLREE